MIDVERDALRDLASAALARKDFGAFCGRFEPGYDAEAPHTKIVREHLEALERREIEMLAIFMPPQHGKSFHVSENFPSWWIGRREMAGGKTNVAITSYGAHKAYDYSRKARQKFLDRLNPFETSIDKASSAVDLWSTVNGSQVIAGGVGGPLTGFGANLLIIDDPVKDAEEAFSEVDREKKWEWYLRVARTRLRRGSSRLLCQTRWHEDDLAGRIMNSAAAHRWTVLTLEARCTDADKDPLHRPVGEVLWPGGPEIPTPGDGETTTKVYEAMYQQNPTPDDGTVFKRAWFNKRYDELPTNLTKAAFYVDGAWKGKEPGQKSDQGISGSRSAIAVWATDGIDYYLVYAWADRVEYPELKTKVPAVYYAYRHVAPSFTPCVESAASGIPILQELKRSTNIPFVGVNVDVSKIVRAEAQAGLFEGGKCYLPKQADWLDMWIEEHVKFPGGKTNDLVDTTSGALARLRGGSDFGFGSIGKRR